MKRAQRALSEHEGVSDQAGQARGTEGLILTHGVTLFKSFDLLCISDSLFIK